jgi:hypothetical protein
MTYRQPYIVTQELRTDPEAFAAWKISENRRMSERFGSPIIEVREVWDTPEHLVRFYRFIDPPTDQPESPHQPN